MKLNLFVYIYLLHIQIPDNSESPFNKLWPGMTFTLKNNNINYECYTIFHKYVAKYYDNTILYIRKFKSTI